LKFKNKELLIFDFDGTLINSIPDLTSAVNKMLANYGLTPLTIEDVTPFIGNGAKALVEKALASATKNKANSEISLEEALKVYFSAYKEITCEETFLYSGVLETLEYLKQKGYKMAISTNKPFNFIEPILDKLEIKEFFKIWIGEDSLPKKKPDAAPILYLADKYKIELDKCIMIGDSKNDILAAHNSGIDSIGVSYGYNYNEDISNYKPTLVIDHFEDMQELF